MEWGKVGARGFDSGRLGGRLMFCVVLNLLGVLVV